MWGRKRQGQDELASGGRTVRGRAVGERGEENKGGRKEEGEAAEGGAEKGAEVSQTQMGVEEGDERGAPPSPSPGLGQKTNRDGRAVAPAR